MYFFKLLAVCVAVGLAKGNSPIDTDEYHHSLEAGRSRLRRGEVDGKAIHISRKPLTATNMILKASLLPRAGETIPIASSWPMLRLTPGDLHYVFCSVCNADKTAPDQVHLEERQAIHTKTITDGTTTQTSTVTAEQPSNPITSNSGHSTLPVSTSQVPPSSSSPAMTTSTTTDTSIWWRGGATNLTINTVGTPTDGPFGPSAFVHTTDISVVVIQTTVTIGANPNATASSGAVGWGKGGRLMGFEVVVGIVLGLVGLIILV
jgi:hypothetical protein